MGLFSKKSYSLSDILRGVQGAVNGAQDMLQAQQAQSLMDFWITDGKPVTRRVAVAEQELDVPLLTLVPHNQLAMDDVEIKFKSRVGSVVAASSVKGLTGANTLSQADLQMEMTGIRSDDTDLMEITIRFKAKEPPEGVARLMDEYNKQF